MNRRTFLKTLGAAAVTAPFAGATKSLFADDPPNRPNIVLIHVDDLGWMDINCFAEVYGNDYYETDHIDALAQNGMRFTNGYAACAVCSPTRAALMTGCYPSRVGITDWIRPSEGTVNPEGYEGGTDKELLCPKNYIFLDPSYRTLAEVTKSAGYATCHIGKWHLGGSSFYPDDQGFDYNIGGTAAGQPPGYFDPYGISTLPNRQAGEYLTDREADEAQMFIQNAVNAGQPFFLYMSHYAVHTPVQAKQDYIDYFETKTKPAGYGGLKAIYAAMIKSVDDAVGVIMDKLTQAGVSNDTLVIFASDNGGLVTYAENQPLRGGKGEPWEGGIRVPWIVRWPGVVPAGTVCSEPICSIDVMPTLCEILDVRMPSGQQVDGVSLMPLLTQAGSLPRNELIWHFPHYRNNYLRPYSIIRAGNWKLIKRYAGSPKYELYDLGSDLSEQTNLADAMPNKVKQLEERLSYWLHHTNAKMPIENPDFNRYEPEQDRVRIG